MWRVLIESIGELGLWLGDVDLADLPLRSGLDGVGDDLVVELLMENVAGHDRPVLAEIDVAVLELRRVVGVDARWRDLRDPADPIDAVVTQEDCGRRVARCPEQRGDEGLVELTLVLLDPSEVAGLRRGRAVGRDRPGDLVPGLAALEVREGGVGLGLGGFLLGSGRLGGAGVGLGLDLDDPGVSRLGQRGFGDQAGVDIGVGVGDAFLGRKGCLELRVDDPLECDRGDLLLLLGDELELRLGLGVRKVPRKLLGPDPALGLAQAPALDGEAVDELVLGDRLAVDAAHRGEMVVVPGQPGGNEEDDDGDDDDEAEAEVHVEVASILAFPRGTVGALGDGFGSEGHVT